MDQHGIETGQRDKQVSCKWGCAIRRTDGIDTGSALKLHAVVAHTHVNSQIGKVREILNPVKWNRDW